MTSAKANSSIESLLESGDLYLTFESKGRHSGSCIRVIAENMGDEFILTTIAPGRKLAAANEASQDIIITQEVILALSPNQVIQRDIFGFCGQSQNRNPEYESRYYLGAMADSRTIKIATYLNKHRLIPESDQQAAIWVSTDCHPLSSINRINQEGLDLIKYTASVYGMPSPWYSTEHAQTVDQLFSAKVNRVYGEIPFQITQSDMIHIVIIDDSGRIMKRLISAKYGPGKYTLPVDLMVHNWPSGAYNVQFESKNHGTFADYSFNI
ncbi:MAG: hypothetical protein WEC59_10960 [Salibacteraceae bacterium]